MAEVGGEGRAGEEGVWRDGRCSRSVCVSALIAGSGRNGWLPESKDIGAVLVIGQPSTGDNNQNLLMTATFFFV